MRKLTLLSLIILVLVLTGCNKKDTATEESAPGKDTEPEGEIDKDVDYFPFTGMPTKDEIDNRAVAVMVSNVDAARPQTGLSMADIVFEMLTESNITRFMAIYQSEEPEVVGPVRSAREYFFTLADNYDAVYIYSGAANFVNDMIASRGIEHIEGGNYDNDGHLIVRETFRKAPHNMYLLYDAVDEIMGSKGYETTMNYEPLAFLKEDEALPGYDYIDGTYAKIDYYGSKPIVEYEYDDTTEKYTRISDGEQTVELESEIPIEMDNVLIVEADHRVIDEEQRRAIDIETGGNAILLQRGKALELEWENQDGRIVPVKDGAVVPFVPGKTWINFVQTNPGPKVQKQVQVGNE